MGGSPQGMKEHEGDEQDNRAASCPTPESKHGAKKK
jgi:hypothetical protein